MKHSLSTAVVLMAGAIALTACAGGMQVVSQNSDAVSIRHSPDRGGDAAQQAQASCSNYGKKARYRSVHPDANNQQYAIYDCVPL
jgi:hypothetical protein